MGIGSSGPDSTRPGDGEVTPTSQGQDPAGPEYPLSHSAEATAGWVWPNAPEPTVPPVPTAPVAAVPPAVTVADVPPAVTVADVATALEPSAHESGAHEPTG